MIYLDFKKAHDELLVILWSFGITESLWNWFNTYRRKQCVHLKIMAFLTPYQLFLEFLKPQGSVLGPILLLIFVNNLPDSVLSSKVLLLADDTKMF